LSHIVMVQRTVASAEGGVVSIHGPNHAVKTTATKRFSSAFLYNWQGFYYCSRTKR